MKDEAAILWKLMGELPRIRAECSSELPEGLDTPAKQARALLDCDDPPAGRDNAICRLLVLGTSQEQPGDACFPDPWTHLEADAAAERIDAERGEG